MEWPKKACNSCKEEKPAYDYTFSKKRPDGLNTMCKKCVLKRKKKTDLDIMRNNSLEYGVNPWKHPKWRKKL